MPSTNAGAMLSVRSNHHRRPWHRFRRYLFIILKLDNKGEGGILALSALIRGASKNEHGRRENTSFSSASPEPL
jgi:hypothetical protein